MTEVKLKNLSQEEIADLLPPNLCLLGYRGSIAHGMYLDPNREDSIDDKDIMGVCFAPKNVYLGLQTFEQKEKQYKEWDSVVYEFRKFVRLLILSNPNVLSLLWMRDQHYIYRDDVGWRLINNRNLFSSKRIFHSFTGYAYAQMKRMTHASFEGYMGAKRKAIVEKFGYDTKNAAHCIRLLRMGIEFLREGELHVFREDAPQLVEIKIGRWTLEHVQREAEELFKRAEQAYDETKLPNYPDVKKIEEMVMATLHEYMCSEKV